jgi:hypothetical protein
MTMLWGIMGLYDKDRGCLPSRSPTVAGVWVAGPRLRLYSSLRAGLMVMVMCSLILSSSVGLEDVRTALGASDARPHRRSAGTRNAWHRCGAVRRLPLVVRRPERLCPNCS